MKAQVVAGVAQHAVACINGNCGSLGFQVHLPATIEVAGSRYGLHVASVVRAEIGNSDSLTDVLAGERVLASSRVDKLY